MTTSHARADTGSIVHDHQLTLDLRTRPTRADVGLTGERSSRSYEQLGSGPLQAKVELPSGTLTLPVFVVTANTDDANGAGGPVRDRAPKNFVLNRRFANAADARAAMEHDAKILGLRQSEIDSAFADLGKGAAVPQNADLHGLVDGVLSADVEVNDIDDGKVQAIYQFHLDQFHNPALDRVVHDGVFSVDLTARPTRAALGFLPHYWTATVRPSFFDTLHVDFTLAAGHHLQTQADSVTSTSAVDGGPDPDGVGAPDKTRIVRTMSVEAARAQLTAQASALGLRAADVAAAFHGTGRAQKTLAGATTDVYSLEVEVDANLEQPGNFAANLTYTLTYR